MCSDKIAKIHTQSPPLPRACFTELLIRVNDRIKKGEAIATIAGSYPSKSGIRPHLHLSLALTNHYISYERFNWQSVGSRDMLTLLDPLDMLDRPYRVLQQFPNSRR